MDQNDLSSGVSQGDQTNSKPGSLQENADEIVHKDSTDLVASPHKPMSRVTTHNGLSLAHNSCGNVLTQLLSPANLATAASNSGSWLWYGYLGAGKVTLLTSQWKSGKTTLVAVLMSRMATGGQLAGLPVSAGKALIVSEEGKENWAERCRRLNMKENVSFLCRPFPAKPTMDEWRALMDAMLQLRRSKGLDLVVIDPLAVFLPGNSENLAGVMTECLLPLQDLTARGMSVLLIHHPRKGANLAGQAARGSGALASYVDILIEMNWFGNPQDDDRRRWLRAFSRSEETRRHLLLELTPAGDDYLVHDAKQELDRGDSWQALCFVLEDATEPITQNQIITDWPEDFRAPNQATISRLLMRGVEQGMIGRSGSGRRNDRYHYWLVKEGPEK